MPFLGLCHDVGPSPAMISPLYKNGDVNQYLVQNPQADRQAIVLGVARGLEYLHAQNVIHGDIKGHNVLVADDGTPRLSDFGRSKLIEHRGFTTATIAGSARQMAPELLPASESESDGPPELAKEADVYAFSMVALESLSGKLPFFYVATELGVVLKVLNGQRPERSKYPTIFTDDMWGLLVDCWGQTPQNRPNMNTVLQRLQAL